MASNQELKIQQKRELEKKEEATIPTRVFVPTADIFENNDALTVVLEMPGVERNNIDVRVEGDILRVHAHIDLSKYKGLLPIYTEYNIGDYARDFRISSKIEQNKISAELRDGVLWLTLPKGEEAKPRTIQIK